MDRCLGRQRWPNGEYEVVSPRNERFLGIVLNRTFYPGGVGCDDLVQRGYKIRLRSQVLYWRKTSGVAALCVIAVTACLLAGELFNQFSWWFFTPLLIPVWLVIKGLYRYGK